MLVFEATTALSQEADVKLYGRCNPLAQMTGIYCLLSNAAGIAHRFKRCGSRMRRMESDR